MTDKLRAAAEMALEALEDTLALCINYKSVEDADGYVFTEASDVIKQGESAHNALRQALDQLPDTTEMIERTSMTASELADRIKRGEKWQPLYTGIDRGAWSDVPDATKWVDELRGDEELPPVKTYCGGKPNYCQPEELPKREWVGLTNEEIESVISEAGFGCENIARAVEAKLKEKNT